LRSSRDDTLEPLDVFGLPPPFNPSTPIAGFVLCSSDWVMTTDCPQF
jgi:hypothetical protein